MHRVATLFTPIDPRPLAIARVIVGLCVALKFVDLAGAFIRIGSGEVVRIPWSSLTIPLSSGFTMFLVLSCILTALVFASGYATRFTGLVLTLSMVFILSTDQQMYRNHFYLLIWITGLLTVSTSNGAWSIDSWRRGYRVPGEAWQALLLMAKLSVVYGFATIAKLNTAFLSGAVLQKELVDPFPELLAVPALGWLAGMSSVLCEGFLAFGLWFKRTRIYAVVTGILLHAGIILLMGGGVSIPFIVFGFMLFALYPLFFQDRFGSEGLQSGREADTEVAASPLLPDMSAAAGPRVSATTMDRD